MSKNNDASRSVGAISFDREYYRRVIQDNGYDPNVFEGFTKDIPTIPREDLEKVFLCHQGLYNFTEALGKKAVLTGFGLSGVPHMGTLAQINRIGMLNRAGFPAEVVLGDLDAYNGKLTTRDQTTQYADQYQKFIEGTELLDPDTSRVRNQSDYPEVLKTAYLLGRFIEDADLDGAEEDLHDFYTKHGKVDSSMTYRRKLSLNLMLADFIHLGQTNPNVLVMLGLDEHQYVRAGQDLSKRVDPYVSGLQPVTIDSLYTPIIAGLNGYPKMSKSFKDSSIDLDMSPDDIQGTILGEKDTHQSPEESVVYQMACGIGLGESASLEEARQAALNPGSREWTQIKTLLIGRVAMFSNIWKEASIS